MSAPVAPRRGSPSDSASALAPFTFDSTAGGGVPGASAPVRRTSHGTTAAGASAPILLRDLAPDDATTADLEPHWATAIDAATD